MATPPDTGMSHLGFRCVRMYKKSVAATTDISYLLPQIEKGKLQQP